MTDLADVDATLDELEETAEETAEQIDELAERVETLADDLGVEPTRPDVKPVEKADLEALLSAPDERAIHRLEARLSTLEAHMGHRGPGPCPCARCERLRRLKRGDVPSPWPGRRVTLTENGDKP